MDEEDEEEALLTTMIWSHEEVLELAKTGSK